MSLDFKSKEFKEFVRTANFKELRPALQKSIGKWNRIIYQLGVDKGGKGCELCELRNRTSKDGTCRCCIVDIVSGGYRASCRVIGYPIWKRRSLVVNRLTADEHYKNTTPASHRAALRIKKNLELILREYTKAHFYFSEFWINKAVKNKDYFINFYLNRENPYIYGER